MEDRVRRGSEATVVHALDASRFAVELELGRSMAGADVLEEVASRLLRAVPE